MQSPEILLQGLRQGTAVFAKVQDMLQDALQQSGQTLADIGTSEQELIELERGNARRVGVNYAIFWLNKLRTTHKGNPQCLTQLKKEMREHNITMEEIGATDADLA